MTGKSAIERVSLKNIRYLKHLILLERKTARKQPFLPHHSCLWQRFPYTVDQKGQKSRAHLVPERIVRVTLTWHNGVEHGKILVIYNFFFYGCCSFSFNDPLRWIMYLSGPFRKNWVPFIFNLVFVNWC